MRTIRIPTRYKKDIKNSVSPTLGGAFADYYRGVGDALDPMTPASLDNSGTGYFRFGDITCYGRLAGKSVSASATDCLADALPDVEFGRESIRLPFDLAEVVENFRREQYSQRPASPAQKVAGWELTRNLYHTVRPLLPVGVRKHLQRVGLNGWSRISFPRWPVDTSVEQLMERVMVLALRHSGVQRQPFIWFWPEGADGCLIMTHDVEGKDGRDFCHQLIDLDQAHGISSAFQIVPEGRYDVTSGFLESIRRRGCEVNIHDLDHDGRLFKNAEQFWQRAVRINEHLDRFGSRGFRAGVMYRQLAWLEALNISYDMSVPNVAHLEPQRGGCCTVMPYFIRDIVELPLTTTQDYSLFHILGEYSIELWRTQIDLILEKHGLVSFITHPDYLLEPRAMRVYRELLEHVCRLRGERHVWAAVPGEVDRWWRSRSQMRLIPSGRGWRIEGPEAERARVAYAVLDGDRLSYEIDGGTAYLQ